jgi:GMP synthase (glutamine-hydrolysing)
MNYSDFIENQINEIRKKVGDNRVISALSGGVDSAAATVLVHKAIGNQLDAIFIDDGLMRENEFENVSKSMKKAGINARLVVAQDEFFSALKGKADPEEKRKTFRNTFYKALGRIARQSNAKYLVQGTIKADIDETKGGVKTQHNVLEQIGLDPGGYGLSIIEPLKDFYKPEVREIARQLGLPEEIHQRMPFPGPGLATRVVGEANRESIAIVRKAEAIVEEETKELKPFQAFAVLMNDKATGLEGRERKFGNIIIVRCVDSEDALTATATYIPWNILLNISEKITKELPSVVRVAYEITGKPPATIEYV